MANCYFFFKTITCTVSSLFNSLFLFNIYLIILFYLFIFYLLSYFIFCFSSYKFVLLAIMAIFSKNPLGPIRARFTGFDSLPAHPRLVLGVRTSSSRGSMPKAFQRVKSNLPGPLLPSKFSFNHRSKVSFKTFGKLKLEIICLLNTKEMKMNTGIIFLAKWLRHYAPNYLS